MDNPFCGGLGNAPTTGVPFGTEATEGGGAQLLYLPEPLFSNPRKRSQMNAKWRQRAACQGLDPDIFYPSSEEEGEEAKAICATCPVRQLCLEHALINRERDGIWGGLTDRERRRLVRQRRKTA